MSSGNGLIKIDFHVHTPHSQCYNHDSRHVTPQEIVDAAIEAGLDGFAITDHNTAQGVEPIREVARSRGLVVFPGLEITTPGGHVLAFFDPDAPIATLDDLLRDVGVPPDKEGNPWHETKDWIVEVFAKIVDHGGLAVAAHIERGPRGFMEQVRDRATRKAIHSSDHLSALEITVPNWKSLWNEGQVAGFPKKYPVIQGSDAHSPQEMGRRPVYLSLSSLSLHALQVALAEHATHLFFPDEIPPPDRGRVERGGVSES